jgi:biotin carboxyl carrier protein
MGKVVITAPVGGSIWMLAVGVDQEVTDGALLLILEVMKTEFPIEAPVKGRVVWLGTCNATVEVGDKIAVLESAD